MFKHLLVPVDASALSARAIDVGLDLAREFGAAITAFIAEPPAPAPATGRGLWHYLDAAAAQRQIAERHAEGVLANFERRAAAAGIPFEGLYAQSTDVDAAIDAVARERGCDVIVMVTHGAGSFGGRWSRSCTQRMVARTRLPLLVIH
jgi:nucleotide-binding universal stress UspA family protein